MKKLARGLEFGPTFFTVLGVRWVPGLAVLA